MRSNENKHKKGEVWKVSDRHGNMTIKLLEDVDESKDCFFEAMIVDGQKTYISMGYVANQRETGEGTAGHKCSFRTGLCHFTERLEPPEVKKD